MNKGKGVIERDFHYNYLYFNLFVNKFTNIH